MTTATPVTQTELDATLAAYLLARAAHNEHPTTATAALLEAAENAHTATTSPGTTGALSEAATFHRADTLRRAARLALQARSDDALDALGL